MTTTIRTGLGHPPIENRRLPPWVREVAERTTPDRVVRLDGRQALRRKPRVRLPKIFFVDRFRRGDEGQFLWPGLGENSRILVAKRIDTLDDGLPTSMRDELEVLTLRLGMNSGAACTYQRRLDWGRYIR